MFLCFLSIFIIFVAILLTLTLVCKKKCQTKTIGKDMNTNENLTLSKKELCNLYQISTTTLWRVCKNLPTRFTKKRIFSGSDLQTLKTAIETR